MKYEGSKADKLEDKKAAKKAGMAIVKWESSTADKKADRKATKKNSHKK